MKFGWIYNFIFIGLILFYQKSYNQTSLANEKIINEKQSIESLPQENNNPCFNLVPMACKAEKAFDGTGSTALTNELFTTKQLNQIDFKIQSELEAEFKNNENQYFIGLNIAAANLDQDPNCIYENNVPTPFNESCKNKLFPKLKNLYKNAIDLPGEELEKTTNLQNLSLLMQHPSTKKILNISSNFSFNFIQKENRKFDVEKKIFPRVISILENIVNNFSIPSGTKNILISKIKSIRFGGTDCNKNNTNSILGLTDENAYLENYEFKICNGLLSKSNSELALAMIIAHELQHAIDTCEVTKIPFLKNKSNPKTPEYMGSEADKNHLYSNLIRCFRSPKSVEAKYFDVNLLQDGDRFTVLNQLKELHGESENYPYNYCLFGFQKKLDAKENELNNVSALKKQFQYVPHNINDLVIIGDQSIETMSDWMAAEVGAQYMEKYFPNLTTQNYRQAYANFGKILCSENEELNNEKDTFDIHPTLSRRLNKIILANPKIRQQMKCPELNTKTSEIKYCSMENYIPDDIKNENKTNEIQLNEPPPVIPSTK